jgi:hypothetical protein
VSAGSARLPRRTLRAGTRLYRIHRAAGDPWFFSCGPGRFDPVGIPGRGASYWAQDALGAWVETFRTRMLLPEREIAERRLSIATLREELVVCDLTVRRALSAGVTVALTAGGDYSASQALANRLHGEYAAVRWRVRHDLRQRLIGVACFGDTEPGATTRAALPATATSEIPDELISTVCRLFRYQILPNPPS